MITADVPPLPAAGSLHRGSSSSGDGNCSASPTGRYSPARRTATEREEEPAQLGFPSPATETAADVHLRQSHAAPVTTQSGAPSSLLGFQPPPSQRGGFPKISSNFDLAGNKERSPDLAVKQMTNHSLRKQAVVSAAGKTLTFAEAAARRAARPPDLFVHNMQAIKPVRMNEDIAVIIPSDMYETRLNSFQFALIGRLLLPQGSDPRGGEDLKRELVSLFGTANIWALMPLGKGYFSLKFNSVEDKIKASRMNS